MGRVGGGFTRGAAVDIEVDGERLEAFLGETVGAALVAAGRRGFRRTGRLGAPRGLYCGIGLCFDCLVWVEGAGRVRACQTPVAAGMRVRTEGG
jgi:predicted molibdopterin-dependent oxidoreductase YjgC